MSERKIIKIEGMPRTFLLRPNANVVFTGSVDRKIDSIELRRAVSGLYDRHPLLGARLRMVKDEVRFKVDRTIASDIETRNMSDIDEIVKDQLSTAFNLWQGPLIRFCLNYGEHGTDIIICCHHMICDGLSLVYILRDILMRIAGPEKTSGKKREPVFFNRDNIPMKIDSLLTRIFINNINKKLEKIKYIPGEKEKKQVHKDFWSGQKAGIKNICFSRERSNRFFKKCSDAGVTVNTGLIAVIMEAEEKALPGTQYRDDITIAVNVRDKLIDSPGDMLGYYASAVRIKPDPGNKAAFEKRAQYIKKIIDKKMRRKEFFKTQAIGLFDGTFMDIIIQNLYGLRDDDFIKDIIKRKKMDRISNSFTISNLGRIEIPCIYGDMKLDSLSGPFILSENMEKYISALTFDGRLSIFFSYTDKNIDDGKIDEIINIVNNRI